MAYDRLRNGMKSIQTLFKFNIPMILPRSGSFHLVTSPTMIIQLAPQKITRASEKQLYDDGTGKKQLGAHFKSFFDSLSQVRAGVEGLPERDGSCAIFQWGDMHRLAPQPAFTLWVNEHQVKFKIGTSGKPITVKNDGNIYIVKEVGFRRREQAKVPITNYDAKRRDAGGVKAKGWPEGEIHF
ncbi:uncharacterized protein ACHE_11629A [Aspergillus chevalieri]|uniref:Uncharacterized protein n=1 Tax=Aspergillus chevalieri TaxID=182096 RepID=A0A7R7ZKM0_ASPCH|nr:uncharacterized protein ACHE_11629A [Aspergillus chevalieri]BCR84227.1 hypothetical protein ACHE_11629A [Aspergillus chevalieri]